MISTKKLTTTCLLLAHQLQISAKFPVCYRNINSALEDPCVHLASKKNMDEDNFKYQPGTSSVAFVTAPDEKIARNLAIGLVEQKLAACVNIIPNIQSVYMWEDKLNEDNEHLMIIKTRTSRLEELSKWVRDKHPYSVAEVITFPIEQGNIPYMKWLSEAVPEIN